MPKTKLVLIVFKKIGPRFFFPKMNIFVYVNIWLFNNLAKKWILERIKI